MKATDKRIAELERELEDARMHVVWSAWIPGELHDDLCFGWVKFPNINEWLYALQGKVVAYANAHPINPEDHRSRCPLCNMTPRQHEGFLLGTHQLSGIVKHVDKCWVIETATKLAHSRGDKDHVLRHYQQARQGVTPEHDPTILTRTGVLKRQAGILASAGS
jgi:hypothetical protein